MKWYEYLQSTKDHTPGEDFVDSIVLFIICALVVLMITM